MFTLSLSLSTPLFTFSFQIGPSVYIIQHTQGVQVARVFEKCDRNHLLFCDIQNK